jgi:hypothetical protein
VENALREGWRWSDIAASLGLSKQAAHRKYAQAMRPRLERDTGAARLAVLYARQEAAALGAPALGTEHLLLGLARLGGTRVAGVLAGLDVTGEGVRQVLATLAPEPGGPPFTVPARAALQEALRGRASLEPEHVLFAVLRQDGCGALRALDAMGVEPDAVRGRFEPVAA